MSEKLWNAAAWLRDGLAERKILFESTLSFSDDVVHVFVGVAIMIIGALLMRKRLGDALPLVPVFLLAIANEVMDVTYETWPNASEQLGYVIKDILITVAMPVTLFVIARWVPGLWGSRARQQADTDPDGERGCEPADDLLRQETDR